MEKDGSLRISKWETGIGASPYFGFGQMTNVDIYSKPGSVKISNRLQPDLNSADLVDGLMKWMVQAQNGDVYAVDDNGKLYKRNIGSQSWAVITGHGVSGANGNGLGIWNGYLFYARNIKLDVMEISSGTWTNDWKDTLENANPHPILSAQDGHLYIGNGNFVNTVIQTIGDLIVNPLSLPFNPANTDTYTYNDPQLTLPTDYDVVCLEDVGTNVAIGTKLGNNNTINIADIFFWDGASDSYVRGATVHLAENGVKMMKNTNNILNIIAGNGAPRVFNAVTSQSVEVKRFNNISVPFISRLSLFPDAIDALEGEVLFGIGASTSSPGNPNPLGVYALRDKAYVLRYLISTLNDGSIDGILIGTVQVISGNEILVSWRDGNNTPEYGIDILTKNFYTNYSAYIESPIYSVGTDDDPKTFERVQITLGKKLKTGDGVRIKARYNLEDSFVTIATFDTPTYTNRNVMEARVANLDKFKEMQIRIEITTASNSTESPELKEVRFK